MSRISSFYPGLEQEISGEIRDWSRHALESPNKEYGGLPACAYAKKARGDDKVGFSFKYSASYQPLYTIVSTFDDSYDVVILVDLIYEKSSKKFHEYLWGLNGAISEGFVIQKDMWVMGFHPDDEPNEDIDDGSFEPEVDTEYAMIFIQRLSKLQEASDKLRKTGYYEHYFEGSTVPSFEARAALCNKLQEEAVGG